jgi:hypothetical protein
MKDQGEAMALRLVRATTAESPDPDPDPGPGNDKAVILDLDPRLDPVTSQAKNLITERSRRTRQTVGVRSSV